jgi:hypothetical protein
MMVALAIPPPSHIVCKPYRFCALLSALTSAVIIRAPLAPSGWPVAGPAGQPCPTTQIQADSERVMVRDRHLRRGPAQWRNVDASAGRKESHG